MALVSQLPDSERLVLQSQGILSLLVLPLLIKDQLFGFLVFEKRRQAQLQLWSASAVDLLRAAAAALSLNQERSKTEAALRQSEAALREKAAQLEMTLGKLKQTQAQLVQSEKMSSLGLMVAGIAHEINNPVSFVYGNIAPAQEYIQDLLGLISLYQQHHLEPAPAINEYQETIDLDFLMEDLPNLLESMKLGAERIRDIVVSLRTFSRVDEGDIKRIDIHEGLESTLLILQHRLKQRPERPAIEVIKNYGTLPPVECYPGQLNQVFMNVLTNAIDALEPQRVNPELVEGDQLTVPIAPRIQVSTAIIDSGNLALHAKKVVIRIADNGVGITEQVRQRLFDPFFTTKPVGKGTGLGLSISYQIVVGKHGGELRCVSIPGQGTEFIVEIPILQSCRRPIALSHSLAF